MLLATIALWCLREIKEYRGRIIARRFIQREFRIEDDCIIVRPPGRTKTNLDAPPISEHTLFGKFYYGIAPYLVMAVPMAYPIQRLLSDAGGFTAVLLFLSILGTPLSIYILGRITRGAYLWIYKVWQLERRHGKPVVFDEA